MLNEAKEKVHIQCGNRQKSSENLKSLYYEILDTIVFQMRERFKNFQALQFLELVDSKNFTGFKKTCPEHL